MKRILGLLLIAGMSYGALQSVKIGMVIPALPASISTAANIGNGTALDALDEKVAVVFMVPKTGCITGVHFRENGVSTGGTFTIRLETVTPTGVPSGTLWSVTSSTQMDPTAADDNKWWTHSLVTGATAQMGDYMALVWTHVSGDMTTPSFADENLDFTYSLSSASSAGWAKAAPTRLYTLSYADGSYETPFGVWPINNAAGLSLSTGTVAKQEALYFKLPFPATYNGVRLWVDADGLYDILLYDSDGATVLSQMSISSNTRQTTAAQEVVYVSTQPVNLSKDVFYRLALKPTTASAISLQFYETFNSTIMGTMPGGADFHFSSTSVSIPTQENQWVQNATKRPFISLILSAFDDAAQTGGASTTNLFILED